MYSRELRKEEFVMLYNTVYLLSSCMAAYQRNNGFDYFFFKAEFMHRSTEYHLSKLHDGPLKSQCDLKCHKRHF